MSDWLSGYDNHVPFNLTARNLHNSKVWKSIFLCMKKAIGSEVTISRDDPIRRSQIYPTGSITLYEIQVSVSSKNSHLEPNTFD